MAAEKHTENINQIQCSCLIYDVQRVEINSNYQTMAETDVDIYNRMSHMG